MFWHRSPIHSAIRNDVATSTLAVVAEACGRLYRSDGGANQGCAGAEFPLRELIAAVAAAQKVNCLPKSINQNTLKVYSYSVFKMCVFIVGIFAIEAANCRSSVWYHAKLCGGPS